MLLLILLSDGQKASLVEAINALYFDPTFDPDLTTPPGKGVITLGKFLIESIAVSHASKHDFLLLLSTKKFPPPIAGTLAVASIMEMQRQTTTPTVKGQWKPCIGATAPLQGGALALAKVRG